MEILNCNQGTTFISILLLILSCKACSAVETPKFRVLITNPDMEVRLYQESSWLSANVEGASFVKSTKQGFHRVYQYMQGANLNSTKLDFTAPIITAIMPKAGGFEYSVMFYLSGQYENFPPVPKPELNLQINRWMSHCVAVRKFAGFAKDDNIPEEKEALIDSISNHLAANRDPVISEFSNVSFAVAQYTAPFRSIDRLNEVWLNVPGSLVHGCP